MAQSIMSKDVYLAWGTSGDLPAWDSEVPDIDFTRDHLEDEVCRRICSRKRYLALSEHGDIEISGHKFLESETPTKTILLEFRNKASDVPNQVIRQLGVYVDTVPVSTKGDVTYLLPSEVTSKGVLIASANIVPIIRNSAISETREIIINF